MSDGPPIPFHAIVRVHSKQPGTGKVDGQVGYVAGITEHPDENGSFGYGVFVYETGRVICCVEGELEWTGKLDEQSTRNAKLQKERLAAKNAR